MTLQSFEARVPQHTLSCSCGFDSPQEQQNAHNQQILSLEKRRLMGLTSTNIPRATKRTRSQRLLFLVLVFSESFALKSHKTDVKKCHQIVSTQVLEKIPCGGGGDSQHRPPEKSKCHNRIPCTLSVNLFLFLGARTNFWKQKLLKRVAVTPLKLLGNSNCGVRFQFLALM